MRLSVILPVLDMADTVGEQFEALSQQTYSDDWELIVVDNGSRDGSQAVCSAWSATIPHMTLVDAPDPPGVSAARNRGISIATGDPLAFCDADDVVDRGWVEACAAAAAVHHFVGGALDCFSLNGADIPAWEARAMTEAPVALSFNPFALGANMVVSRQALDAVGGFCEDLHLIEDVDLSWRLHLAGYPLHFEPAAVVAKRYPRGLGRVWRDSFSRGGLDLELYRRYRHHGVEFPCGPGPLIGDLRRALVRSSPLRFTLQRRALVQSVARNCGRFAALPYHIARRAGSLR